MILPNHPLMRIDSVTGLAPDRQVNTMSTVQRRTVLLRHDLPDGSHHFDWLLELDDDESGPLTTFRLPAPVHELAVGGRVSAERIADHRRRYLEYEGPISGGRGAVRRVQHGCITSIQQQEEVWALTVRWTADPPAEQSLRIEFDQSGPGPSATNGDAVSCEVFCLSHLPNIS